MTVAILANHRRIAPFGLEGGAAGRPGINRWLRADGRSQTLAATVRLDVGAADQVEIATPGGGGFGQGEALAE